MTVEEIADYAAAQVRERALRVGGYCPLGCACRCIHTGAMWANRSSAVVPTKYAAIAAENSRLFAEAHRARAIPVPPTRERP